VIADQFYVQAALWSQVISAILFLAVLVWLWVRYFQPAILAAQERYNKQIAQAERHRDEAKATLELLRGEIDGAARDAKLIRERAAAQGAREYDATIAEAREAGERAVSNARGELGRALAAARERLADEMLSQALLRARAIASENVDTATDARLIDRFAASLEHRATW
jgi:F0F1-type ATP synthase membrane subunit b/b'